MLQAPAELLNQEAAKESSLQVLKTYDPEVQETKLALRGSLHLVKRGVAPRFRFFVLNQADVGIFSEDITEGFEYELMEDKYIAYKVPRMQQGNIMGNAFWFFDKEDRTLMEGFLTRIKHSLGCGPRSSTRETTMEDFLTVSKRLPDPPPHDPSSSTNEASGQAGAPPDNSLARFFPRIAKKNEKALAPVTAPAEVPEGSKPLQSTGTEGVSHGAESGAVTGLANMMPAISSFTSSTQKPTTPLHTPSRSPDPPLLRPSDLTAPTTSRAFVKPNGEDSSIKDSDSRIDEASSGSQSITMQTLERLPRPLREKAAFEEIGVTPTSRHSQSEEVRRERLRQAIRSIAESDEFIALLSKKLQESGI